MLLRRLVSGLAVLTVTLARPSSASQHVRNGGFEGDGGWITGPYATRIQEEPRSGRYCLRAEGASGAAADQTIWSVRPGGTYTVCGWIRTRDVTPQGRGFAFLAVYEHDASGRLIRFADFATVTGTTGWTEYRHTTTLTNATEYVVLKAGIYNALGVAWFDDISMADGAEAVPWREPGPASSRSPRYRAAILDDPSLPVVGRGTRVARFREAMQREGMPLVSLRADDLLAGKLAADAFDLLVLPTGATFPVEGRRSLLAFLMAGGDLLCTGGYAFDHLVVREGSRWVPYRSTIVRAENEARTALVPNGSFEEGAAGWHTEGSNCAIVGDTAASGKHSASVSAETTSASGRWTCDLPVEAGRTYLIGAHARSRDVHGSHYAFLAVYQYDGDGKVLTFNDFAKLTGTSGWTRYEARISVHPAARKIRFHAGLYLATGTLWIDSVTCSPAPQEVRINAHYGEPGDGLLLSPVQLTLFSPDQPLSGDSASAAWPGWPGMTWSGRFSGFDATAQLRQSARWQPLVEARDHLGQLAGAVGSLVTHSSGTFPGSQWALFGVTNRDVFAGAAGLDLLRRTLRLLARELAAASLTTDYAYYHPAEMVHLRLSLQSPRSKRSVSGAVRVELVLDAPGRGLASLHVEQKRLPAGTTLPRTLAFEWRVPAGAPDFVRARAVIRSASGEVMDHIETGFCIASKKVIDSGPRIRYRNNAFELQETGRAVSRSTLFGTDTYGNMFLSPSCNPLTWYRDMAAMRAHGLHMFENLQYPPVDWRYAEAEWRKMDAMIQLAQRFQLPYMAGLLIGVNVAVDDATLNAQSEMCRSFACRYRHVPGLIYYLNGDLRLDMADLPDLRRLWNGFLRERYGSDQALREAWGDEAVQEALGQIPVMEYSSAKPFSQRVRDTRLFQALLVERWVRALTDAIRAEDPEHPITSEYYQRPYAGIDLRLTVDGMDAANFGYFGPLREDLAQLLATIKWNDMRRAGKTINIGEFGVKTHDAWAQEKDGWGYHTARTEEEQRRQLWWVVHAAMAYGVTKIQNWCWADDPDSVFPWGVAYNNPLRPKPVLRLWRNLRPLSDLMPQEYAPAPTVFVMPDSWRLGVSEPMAWRCVATALECLLATGVSFDVVNEADVPALEGSGVRLIVAPFATQMPEGVQEHLLMLARGGATVYVSSPPAEGPLARTASTTKGQDGLQVVGLENGRLVVSAEAWEEMPGFDVFVRHPEVTALPSPQHRSADAEEGGPVAAPSTGAVEAVHNLYFKLLDTAGIEPDARVEAPSGVWRATTRKADGRTLIALFRRDEGRDRVPVTVQTASGHVVRWSAMGRWPALVVLDSNGRVLGATGSGVLTVNGRTIASDLREGDVRIWPPGR